VWVASRCAACTVPAKSLWLDFAYSRQSLAASCTSSGNRQLLISSRPKRRLEFNHQISEALRIHHGALLALESGENLSAKAAPVTMHERGEERAFDVLAPLRARFPWPRVRQPGLAPKLLGLRFIPAAVNISPRSITAIAMLRTSATPARTPPAANDTIGARGRSAGRIRDSHDFARQRGIRLKSAAQAAQHRSRAAPSAPRVAAQTRGMGAIVLRTRQRFG